MTGLFTAFATNPTGSDCIVSSGPILCASGIPSLIVFVPCNDVCPDEKQCTHKVIMFDDVRAVSVGCFVQADVAELLKAGEASSVPCTTLGSMPTTLSAIVTCPPPTKTSAALIKALAATVEDRLMQVTAWAQQALNFVPAAGGTKRTVAAEASSRLRTEDGESAPITGARAKIG